MSAFQNKSLKGISFEDLNLSDNFKRFKSKFNTENIINIQNQHRKQYILSIFSVIFKEEVPIQVIKNFSKLFIEFLECENRLPLEDNDLQKHQLVLHNYFFQ